MYRLAIVRFMHNTVDSQASKSTIKIEGETQKQNELKLIYERTKEILEQRKK